MMRNSWVIAAALAALLTGCESTPDATTSPTPILTPTATSASGTAASGGCPSGSTPDQPGDVAQARPALADWALLAAVDPSGPRIVVGESGFVPEGAGVATVQSMWTFDLCRNAWTEAGDASLPAPGKRPVLYQFVTSPVDGSVLGMALGLAPLWRYDVATPAWRPVEVSGGGSDEAWPMVVLDPADNRLLAFDGNLVTAAAANGAIASGVLVLDLPDGAWTPLELADGDRAVTPNTGMQQYAVAYDSVARRLVLVITPEPSRRTAAAQTWTFDQQAGTWSRGGDVPKTLPNGYPGDGFALAFDPVTARTWAFGDTAMLGYDATTYDWVVAERDAGWPAPMLVGGTQVDPVARTVRMMVVDARTGRLIVIGGVVRPAGGPAGGFVPEPGWVETDDIWAYQPAANTWTLLLGPSDAPASYQPG